MKYVDSAIIIFQTCGYLKKTPRTNGEKWLYCNIQIQLFYISTQFRLYYRLQTILCVPVHFGDRILIQKSTFQLQGQRTLDDLDNGKLTNSFFDKG